MKHSFKRLALIIAIALSAAVIALTCAASGEKKTYNLIKPDSAGGDIWTVTDGIWTGVLNGTGAKAGPVNREINSEGHLLVSSSSDSVANDADHWLGNYIGIKDVLKPGNTYTLTVKIKFDCNPDHALQAAYPGYDCIFIRYSEDSDVTNWKVVNNSTDYQTISYTFTTVDLTDEKNGDAYLQIGPCSQVAAGATYNNYWGGFCPGASFEIASAVLEGDLLKYDAAPVTSESDSDPITPNPGTGVQAAAVLVFLAAAAVGCTVIGAKKHNTR